MSAYSIRKILFLITLLMGGHGLFAQSEQIFPKINSPYSRFGLGNVFEQYYIAAAGMGGLSAAYNDPFHLNLVNPASLSSLQSTAFEVGLYAQRTTLTVDDNSDNLWTGNLKYLALGFPLKNPINKALDKSTSPWSLGMSLSLTPYSLTGYNVEDQSVDAQVGSITNVLKGNGGTYRFLWGNSIKYKEFSVGLSIGYQFGKLTDNRKIQFDNLQAAYDIDVTEDISVGGFIWNAGLQYTLIFKELNDKGELVPGAKRLIFGAYGNSSHSFNTISTSLTLGNNIDYARIDTLDFKNEVEAPGVLPSELGLGVVFENLNKFRVGVDVRSTNWSRYENEAQPENFLDATRVSAGIEFIPDIFSIDSYFERVRYRFGVFFGDDYRTFDGEQLNEFGVTAGIGFPIILPRQRISFFNIALEYSRLGVSEGLKENYLKINFGFTLNDNQWFLKRKFN